MRVKPVNYGQWWERHSPGAPWYAEIYAARQRVHDAFIAWFRSVEKAEGRPLDPVLEVGCGCAVTYPDVFAGRGYVGFDFSHKEIAWCNANRAAPGRRFVCGDFLVDGDRLEKFDLVFSHAVIDHVYDCEAFVEALVRRSRRWVYLTAYRGWFPGLAEHTYLWSEENTCYYNDVSASQLLAQLHKLGCTAVQVMPQDTGGSIPQETVIIAKSPPA